MTTIPPRGRPEIGQVVLGEHRLLERIGGEGFKLVYLAAFEGAEREPELVVCLPAERADDARLEALRSVSHPSLLPIRAAGVDGDHYYVVHDYVHGYDLGVWRRSLQSHHIAPDPDLLVHIAATVLEACEAAHAATVHGHALLHGELCFEDILLGVDGSVHVLGFAGKRIVFDAGDPASSGVPSSQLVFVAPEIWNGEHPTALSDVASVALLLHVALSGNNELLASTPMATVERILTHEAQRLNLVREGLPEGLADHVAMALDKDPSERWFFMRRAIDFAQKLRATTQRTPAELKQALAHELDTAFRDPRLTKVAPVASLASREEAFGGPLGPAAGTPAGGLPRGLLASAGPGKAPPRARGATLMGLAIPSPKGPAGAGGLAGGAAPKGMPPLKGPSAFKPPSPTSARFGEAPGASRPRKGTVLGIPAAPPAGALGMPAAPPAGALGTPKAPASSVDAPKGPAMPSRPAVHANPAVTPVMPASRSESAKTPSVGVERTVGMERTVADSLPTPAVGAVRTPAGPAQPASSGAAKVEAGRAKTMMAMVVPLPGAGGGSPAAPPAPTAGAASAGQGAGSRKRVTTDELSDVLFDGADTEPPPSPGDVAEHDATTPLGDGDVTAAVEAAPAAPAIEEAGFAKTLYGMPAVKPVAPLSVKGSEPRKARGDETEQTTVEPFDDLFQGASGSRPSGEAVAAGGGARDSASLEQPASEPLASAFDPIGLPGAGTEDSVLVALRSGLAPAVTSGPGPGPTPSRTMMMGAPPVPVARGLGDTGPIESSPPPAPDGGGKSKHARDARARIDQAIEKRYRTRKPLPRAAIYAIAVGLGLLLAIGGVIGARLGRTPPKAHYLFVRGDVKVAGKSGGQSLGAAAASSVDDVTVEVAAEPQPGTAGQALAEGTAADPNAPPEAEAAGSEGEGAGVEPSNGALALGPTVEQAFMGKRAALRRCLDENALQIRGNPAIDLILDITADGTVSNVVVQPEGLKDTGLASCLSDVARTVEFAAMHSEVRVRVPVVARAAH